MLLGVLMVGLGKYYARELVLGQIKLLLVLKARRDDDLNRRPDRDTRAT